MDDSQLFALIDRFESGSLTSLVYINDSQKLVLKKTGPSAVPPQAAAAPGAIAAAGTAAPANLDAPQNKSPPAPLHVTPDAPLPECITSPIVATFYAASAPDAPPFVKAGDRVKKGQTLCILEAMKMMNKLDAEMDAEILAVKAASGDLVEFGQALFEVRRLGA